VNALALAWRLGPSGVVTKLRKRAWSEQVSIGVACDPERRRSLAPRGLSLRTEVIDPSELGELGALLARTSGPEYAFLRAIERTRRARAGDLVVARTSGGRLAAVHFVHDERRRAALERVAPGMYPPMAADEVLTEGVWCRPELRGQGVVPAMLDASLGRLAERGVRRALAIIDLANTRSLRAFRRVGFEPSGVVRLDRRRLGQWRIDFEALDEKTRARWRAATREEARVAGVHVAAGGRVGPP
jgi:L-amino acid N-acyltransferase YncA